MLGELYTEYQGQRRKRREHQRHGDMGLPGDLFLGSSPRIFWTVRMPPPGSRPSGENTHDNGSFLPSITKRR